MQQIFIQQKTHVGSVIEPDPQQRHHLQRVLRMKEGETLRVIDAEGAVFCGVLDGVGQIQITELLDEDRELPVTLTLVAGLSKASAGTGCCRNVRSWASARIVPFQSSRTVVKLEQDKVEKKLERWQKIVQEASQQCKRTQRPQVCSPIELPMPAHGGASRTSWRMKMKLCTAVC